MTEEERTKVIKTTGQEPFTVEPKTGTLSQELAETATETLTSQTTDDYITPRIEAEADARPNGAAQEPLDAPPFAAVSSSPSPGTDLFQPCLPFCRFPLMPERL